ncbi:classical arabinogalactan protein 9-like isoform X2 [Triticum dicoccoides]|nr:classical arabinogalactan protein 9-like isoform X2 [Triticum dicoccoides]
MVVPRSAMPATPSAPPSAAKSAPTGPCSAPAAVRCRTAAVEPPPWMLTPAATRPPRSSASSPSTRRRRMRTSTPGSPTTSPKSYTRFRSRAHVNRCRQEHACDIITIRDAAQKDVVRS